MLQSLETVGGSFNNYVDKMRGIGGQKYQLLSTFWVKNVHVEVNRYRWSKREKYVRIVIEWPVVDLRPQLHPLYLICQWKKDRLQSMIQWWTGLWNVSCQSKVDSDTMSRLSNFMSRSHHSCFRHIRQNAPPFFFIYFVLRS